MTQTDRHFAGVVLPALHEYLETERGLTGYSLLHFSEGKYGGIEQVVVTRKDGRQRALSSVLQNATDAWRRRLGRPLPPIGDYST